MTVEFNLPDVGEGLHEAEVVAWLVAEGDRLERNQPFVEIMTDKSNVEMPAPAAGVVVRLGAAVGDIVQVGDLLIVIENDSVSGATSTASGAVTAAPPAGSGPPADALASSGTVTLPSGAGPVDATSATGEEPPEGPVEGPVGNGSGAGLGIRRPKASPATRKLAAELGVDLGPIAGTGPGGRILAEDVNAAAAAPAQASAPASGPEARVVGATTAEPSPGAAPPPLGQMEPGVHALRGIRRATAIAMDRSWSTIPHISASNEIDATTLLAARRQLVELAGPDGPAITPLAIVMLAVARALRRYPAMNASLDLATETITVPDRVNVGVAVATDRGLIVPVVADADRLGVSAMAAEIERLSIAARARSVAGAELTGGTHTVTNYGSAGTHLAAPIIRPGETGITGVGAIAERPIVVDGEVVARPTLPVVVCGDHRLIDGDVMSAFHNEICRTLSAPIGLLL